MLGEEARLASVPPDVDFACDSLIWSTVLDV
jgi:hypothetical protein